MISRREIEAFLERYDAALTSRDGAAIAAHWEAPALIIGFGHAQGLADRAALTDFFSANATGSPGQPTLEGFDIFGDALLTADVTWRGGLADIRFRYTLSGNDETGYCLRAALGAR